MLAKFGDYRCARSRDRISYVCESYRAASRSFQQILFEAVAVDIEGFAAANTIILLYSC